MCHSVHTRYFPVPQAHTFTGVAIWWHYISIWTDAVKGTWVVHTLMLTLRQYSCSATLKPVSSRVTLIYIWHRRQELWIQRKWAMYICLSAASKPCMWFGLLTRALTHINATQMWSWKCSRNQCLHLQIHWRTKACLSIWGKLISTIAGAVVGPWSVGALCIFMANVRCF